MTSDRRPQNEAEENRGKEENERRTALREEQIGTLLQSLSDNTSALLNEIKSQDRTHDTRQQPHDADQICWLRFSALSSIFTAGVLALTLAKTCSLADNAGRQSQIMATQAAIMEEQQAPQINVTIATRRFANSPNITPVIYLNNVGRSVAKALFLRTRGYFIQEPSPGLTLRQSDAMVGESERSNRIKQVEINSLKEIEEMMNDPRLSEDARASLQEAARYERLIGQQRQIEAQFDTWKNPDLPFDEQAPVLPPEWVFERDAEISEKIRHIDSQQFKDFQRRVKQMGITPNSSPYETPVPKGFRSFVVGDLVPGGPPIPLVLGQQIGVDEINAMQRRVATEYVSLRYSYMMAEGGRYTSDDFCFQYLPSLNEFTFCRRPESGKQNK